MNIYLDMDDVVADWMGEARKLVKRNWNYGERIPDSDWNKVKAKQRFYRDLPIKEGAKELVQWCRLYQQQSRERGIDLVNLAFLTALPHDYSMPWAASDKVFWADKHFPGIPVFFGPFSFDKYRYCHSPDDILIDDRSSNCHEFITAGGRAHVYRNWPECHSWLETTLNTR